MITGACEAPPEDAMGRTSTLKGSPIDAAGALSFPTFGRLPVAFQSAFLCVLASAGPSDTAVTERRRLHRLQPYRSIIFDIFERRISFRRKEGLTFLRDRN